MQINWTPEQDATLRTAAEAGWSASEIAATYFPGKSRNAIIGRLHRTGIMLAKVSHDGKSKHSRAGRPRTANYRDRTPKASKPAKSISQPQMQLFSPKSVSFAELDLSHCRYIIGEPNGTDTVYCGCQVKLGMSYCPHHAGKCYGREPSQQRFRTTYGVVF